MGKGGTKFEGEAIGVRAKAKSGLTGKEMRKNMEKFLETGVHPELERQAREAAAEGGSGRVSLPDHDPHRPFVFWDLTIDNRPAGRLVIELYEDLHPAGAGHLRSRCLPGADASLAGASFHKLLRNYAIFGGKSAAAETPTLRPSRFCRNSELGAVSVSADGTEVAIALGRSLTLDATHQVVGRVHLGRDALEALSDLKTTPDDAPLRRVKIARCGATDAKGTYNALDDAAAATAAAAKETPAEAAARLKRESEAAKASVLDALAEGMAGAGGGGGAKRKEPGGGGASTSGGGTGAGGSGATAARAVKPRRAMDPLAGLSSGDDDDDDSSSGSGSDDGGGGKKS